MTYRKPKKRGASAAAYPFSKAKYSGQRQDSVTPAEFKNLHRGKERDLQEAVEQLCGIYGWLRMGTVKHDGIPFGCPGVFIHVPDSAYRYARQFPEIGQNLANFPDIMLWRRDNQVKCLELKRDRGRRSRGQRILAGLVEIIDVRSAEHAEQLIREFSQI